MLPSGQTTARRVSPPKVFTLFEINTYIRLFNANARTNHLPELNIHFYLSILQSGPNSQRNLFPLPVAVSYIWRYSSALGPPCHSTCICGKPNSGRAQLLALPGAYIERLKRGEQQQTSPPGTEQSRH